MDLVAYAGIARVAGIAEKNGISVPRLRGYRLMVEDEPLTDADMEKLIREAEISVFKHAVCAVPPFNMSSNVSEFSWRTDIVKKKYLITERVSETFPDGREESYTKILGIRWNLIHGKKRKSLKLALKKMRRAVIRQYGIYNKYCGRSDVLYIHARIGGQNWDFYGGSEIENQPWFIEKVDDAFDGTYCDIYAKIETE